MSVQSEALIELLSTFGYSIQPNDPSADADDVLIAQLIDDWIRSQLVEVRF